MKPIKSLFALRCIALYTSSRFSPVARSRMRSKLEQGRHMSPSGRAHGNVGSLAEAWTVNGFGEERKRRHHLQEHAAVDCTPGLE